MRSTRRTVPALVWLLATVAVLAVGVAACGGDGGTIVDPSIDTVPPGAPTRASLEGRRFDSTSVKVAGADRPMAGTTPLSIEFRTDALSAYPGCNSTGGPYSIDGDRLVMGAMSSTVMGCDGGALEAQDAWFGGLLAGGPTLRLDGDQLTMTSGDTVIVLVDRKAADPDRPLVGTTWTLESIVHGPMVSSVPTGVAASLILPTDDTITWNACNRSSGHITSLTGTGFSITDVSSTEMACTDGRSQVEHDMGTVLVGPVTYEIDGPVLHVHHGTDGLDFRAH